MRNPKQDQGVLIYIYWFIFIDQIKASTKLQFFTIKNVARFIFK